MVIVTPFQEKKKQRYMIVILIIAALCIFFVIWYKYFPKQKSSPRIMPEKPPKIEINYGILKSKILQELQLFEEIPPLSGDVGRSNPFEPY